LKTPTDSEEGEPLAQMEPELAIEGSGAAALVAEPVASTKPAPEPADPGLDAQAVAANEASPDEEESPAETSRKQSTFQSILDLLHDLAIAVVVCVLLITYVVQAFKVQGTSMSPELHDGERILVNKFIYRVDEIERGDIVVFWYPEDPELSFIKRIVGLPGENVELRDGDVFVDGEEIDESYVVAENADLRSLAAQEIRPGHYFVLGDNRRGSNDSRSWGLVPKRYIYGKAFVRIWPPSQIGGVE